MLWWNTLMRELNKTVMPNKRSRGRKKPARIWNFIRYKFLGFAFRLCTRLNGHTHPPLRLLPLFIMHYGVPRVVARRQPFLDSCSVFFFFCFLLGAPKRGWYEYVRPALMLRALDDLLQFVQGSRVCV